MTDTITPARPDEPDHKATVIYRGWEVGYNYDAAFWGAECWEAYYGGADLEARKVSGNTFEQCLDEIDAQEGD